MIQKPTAIYRAMGIDIAYNYTGWAIMRIDPRSETLKPDIEEYGLIDNSDHKTSELNGLARLEHLFEHCQQYYYNMHELISSRGVLACAIETPFGSRSAGAAMRMGMVYGCIATMQLLMPYLEIRLVHPNDSKRMVTKGRRGTCSKALVRLWVTRMHPHLAGENISEHTIDAIAAFYAWYTGSKAKVTYQRQKKGRSPKNEIERDDVIDV